MRDQDVAESPAKVARSSGCAGSTDANRSMSQMGQCEMWLARDQVTAAYIRDHVEPDGDDLPVPSPLPIAPS
jgi:hypothetical protein